MSKRVLAVVAHGDDEILGCGGTLARHSDLEDEVRILIMTDGVGSRYGAKKCPVEVENRESETREAARLIGAKQVDFFGFPDNKMDSVPLLDIVTSIEDYLSSFDPHIIYTHHANDLNIDHQLTQRATITASRPNPDTSISDIYGFEVLSSSEWNFLGANNGFSPNYFVDISDSLNRKLNALKAYSSEIRNFPHPRSMEACESLAKLRGSTAGFYAAEAFTLLRSIRSCP